jgi:predicted O-methyltransferase YrrM
MKEITGWLDPGVAEAMRKLILDTKPNVCVEIGVFAGKSLVNAAKALKENGKGVIYGIDPWEHDEAVRGLSPIEEDPLFWNNIDLDAVHWECVRAIWENDLREYAVIIRAASQHCYRLFRKKSIDILYIDGGHSEESSYRDVEIYLPRVKIGGHIWFDDANWASTQKAVDVLKKDCIWKKDFGHCHLYQRT